MTPKFERDLALFDKLCEKRRQLSGQIEDVGRTRRAVVEAALDGRSVEAIARRALDRRQLEVCVTGIDDAIERLAQQIANRMAEARGSSAPTLKDFPRSAEQLRVFIQSAVERAEIASAEADRQRESRSAYDAAMARYSELRMKHLQAGLEPIVASERAKSELGEQADDLWPEGSPGMPTLSGHEIGSTIMAGGN